MSRVPSPPAPRATRRVAAHPAVAGFRPAAAALAVAAAFCLPVASQAQPTGAQVVHGQASFSQSGSNLVVTTQNGIGTNHSAINWQSFSVPAGSVTQFLQPSSTSTSINRVVGPDPSAIFGTLSSNGRLVLVNPAGIAVGQGAVVDTAGFTASTLKMSEADAIAGRLVFGGEAAGALQVDGRIVARSGDVVLIAPQLRTGSQAVIEASGAAILAAGQKVEITGRGLEGIHMEVQAGDEAVNLGTLKGDAVGIFAGTLKHSGLVQAQAVSSEGGKVVLKASGGDSIVDGTVTAAAANGQGGSIDVLGQRVGLMAGASLDASGANGGGQVRVGGDYQGKNPDVPNAARTYVDANAAIRADATGLGEGGRVIVWADELTRMHGQISARGGAQGGNGGFAEVSGKQTLEFTGVADLRAPKGSLGSLLLDPEDITIVRSDATSSVNTFPSTNPDAPGGAKFDPSSTGPVQLMDTQLNNQLAYSNVLVKTSSAVSTGTGGQITVNSDAVVNWSTGSQLSLEADKGIDVNGTIHGSNSASELTMLARNGNIVFNSGADVTAGSMRLQAQGSGGNIDTSAVNLTLPGAISMVAAGNVQFGGIRTRATSDGTGASAGTVSLEAGGSVTGSFIDAAGDYRAGGDAGNAGDVKLRAGGGISVDSISAYGGDSYETTAPPGNAGRGGAVTLEAGGDVAAGSIDAWAGGSYGGSSFAPNAAGSAGSIVIKAKGAIGVDYLDVGGGHGLAGTDAGQVNISGDAGIRFTQVWAVGGDSYGSAPAGKGGSVNIAAGGDMLLTPYAYDDAVRADGGYGGYGGTGAGGAGGSVFLKAGGSLTATPQAGEVALIGPASTGPAMISATGGDGGWPTAAGANGGAGGSGGSIRIESGSPLVADGSLYLFAQGGAGGDGTSTGAGGQGGAGGSVDLRSGSAVVLRDPLISAAGGTGGTAGDGVTQAAAGALGNFTASGTSVEVEANLTLDANWTNESVVNVRGSSIVSATGSFRNLSDVHLYDTGQLDPWGGVINEAGARLTSWGSATKANLTQNAGLLDVVAGSTLATPSFFSNAGTVQVNGKLDIGTPALSTRLTSGGLLAASMSGETFTNQSSGTVTGTGEIAVSGGVGTVENFGTLAPGGAGSIGRLTLNGNLVMQSGSVVATDLLSATNYDTIKVSGMATTGGTYAVTYQPGASFASGATFDVLQAGALSAGTLPGVDQPQLGVATSGGNLQLVAKSAYPAPVATEQQQVLNQVVTFAQLFLQEAQAQQEEDRKENQIGKDDIVVTDNACKPQ